MLNGQLSTSILRKVLEKGQTEVRLTLSEATDLAGIEGE